MQIRAYRQKRFGDATPRSVGRNFILAYLMRWAAKPTFYRDVGIISAGAGGFYLYNLEEVPVRRNPMEQSRRDKTRRDETNREGLVCDGRRR